MANKERMSKSERNRAWFGKGRDFYETMSSLRSEDVLGGTRGVVLGCGGCETVVKLGGGSRRQGVWRKEGEKGAEVA